MDGHSIHLYASRWEASALPPTITYHKVDVPRYPRFLRPWLHGFLRRYLRRSRRSSATWLLLIGREGWSVERGALARVAST